MPPKTHAEDPWQNIVEADRPPVAAQSVILIKTIEGVEPLGAQIGVYPKKSVPDALREALFHPPEPSRVEIKMVGGDHAAVSTLHTYAILDAAKVTSLPELLEDSGLEYCCLFKGAAYDDLKSAAPWIVRLEEGNSFTRNLFTRSDVYCHLWDSEPGIHVRSSSTLDDLWGHFRKFTRVQDEDGKWLYFRFWEPRWMGKMITGMDPAGQQRFMSKIRQVTGVVASGTTETVFNTTYECEV